MDRETDVALVVGIVSMMIDYFEHVGRTVGIAEVVVAAAYITAPAIGSAVFQTWGYHLPFIILALVQFSLLIFAYLVFTEYALPEGDIQRHCETCTPVKMHMFLTPTTRLTLGVTAIAMTSFGFIDPTLGQHMQTVLGSQHTAVGIGFALSSLVYFVTSIVFSRWAYPWECRTVILSGLTMLALGFFLLGPSPLISRYVFFSGYSMWVCQWVSLICLGCGTAFAVAPSVSLAINSVRGYGKDGLQALVGLFSSAVYLGQACGPFIASLLMFLVPGTWSPSCVELFGNDPTACDTALPWASTVFGGLVIVSCCICAAFLPNDRVHENTIVLQRDGVIPIDYGQFVFLDDDMDSEGLG